ncbi:MAG: hypothetical protein ACK5KL_00350 [Dysgonomonas sp.]
MEKETVKILEEIRINSINPLDDYSTNLIQELIEELKEKEDQKTADEQSTLDILVQELEKREEKTK